ncbi:J domain-containing protein [Oceanomicrobium pacificus]|uniref:DnaJ domain-containing protein n=1 Tax=Oceanomicrobium pacificus TaxID=2692916 RepID=A0A6B0TNK2_9RHOB|nr:J domain-containing protein [Oceanomicrobium pacificus]MXU65446.1 DnaJ domain-containing protein [Oceanomicrobium pacificus]
MNRRSPFEFDISVSADKKRRARRRGMSGAVETSSRPCHKEGCTNPGKFRAPRSPDNLDEFYWFCLDHIREYNQKWNFFENHSESEMEKQFAADKVWERSTKPMKDKEGRAWQRFGFDDPMEILGDNATINPAAGAAGQSRRKLPPTERKAVEILEADDSMTKSEIRKLYKALVKVLHPDLNGGKRDDEERLAEVVWAWDQIKVSRSFRD